MRCVRTMKRGYFSPSIYKSVLIVEVYMEHQLKMMMGVESAMRD